MRYRIFSLFSVEDVMEQLFQFLQAYIDYIILGLLGLMSIILVWKIVERILFYSNLKVAEYETQEEPQFQRLGQMRLISAY